MKTLLKSRSALNAAGRWDIDFHLPAEGLRAFPTDLLKPVSEVGFIASERRDPTQLPEESFRYVDIASVDVSIGVITNPQDVLGEEAPSRARKVIRGFDIVISNVRPTRGAIAVVPPELHNQIASTGFSILRAHDEVNPLYLHFAMRLPSTLEQFRKWSTGSSYPAILDPDVLKTLIPVPPLAEQDAVASAVMHAFSLRDTAIRQANQNWTDNVARVTGQIASGSTPISGADHQSQLPTNLAEIQAVLQTLPPLISDAPGRRRGRSRGIDQLELSQE